MALKPITRKEQIIAGKEFEPITRMEKFLKEYGGCSSPKLLGEIVLTSENTTISGDGIRTFNEELQTKVQNLFQAVQNSGIGVFGVATIATAVVTDCASYVFGVHSFGLTDGIVIGRGVTELGFSTTGFFADPAVAALIDRYPMTIKVYAT